MATDIVAGLRILRGIGGEETFGSNYAAQSQRSGGRRRVGHLAGRDRGRRRAVLRGASGQPGVARHPPGDRRRRLSVGQLVSFLGYGLFMVWPIRTFFEFAQKCTRALVSRPQGDRRSSSSAAVAQPAEPPPARGRGEIVDELSGVVVEPGPADRRRQRGPGATPPRSPTGSAATCRPSSRRRSRDDSEELTGRAARRARAERERRRARHRRAATRSRGAGDWGVTARRRRPAPRRLDDVRRSVLVSDTGSQLFAGTLQDAVDPRGRLTREQAERPCAPPAAEDVYDALPGGWQGRIDERGRGLSGGQRQRVVLARALPHDPDVLVLVEPTSAVDAHTEARIAERVADQRRGRTTVVMHRVAAGAAPRRRGGPAGRRAGGRPRHPRRPAGEPGLPRRGRPRHRRRRRDRTGAERGPSRADGLDEAGPAMTDLLATSRRHLARPPTSTPGIPDGAGAPGRADAAASGSARCAGRHRLRAAAGPGRSTPRRGTPSAARRCRTTAPSWTFVRGLLATRRGVFVALVVAQRASPPPPGCVVPRLLGELVDTRSTRRGCQRDALATRVIVVAVVLVQSVLHLRRPARVALLG